MTDAQIDAMLKTMDALWPEYFDSSLPKSKFILERRKVIRAAMAAAAPEEPTAVPVDPLDWPLPCDVEVGNTRLKKGDALRELVFRAARLHFALKSLRTLSATPPEQQGGA